MIALYKQIPLPPGRGLFLKCFISITVFHYKFILKSPGSGAVIIQLIIVQIVFFVAVWSHYFHSSLTANLDGFPKLGRERFLKVGEKNYVKGLLFKNLLVSPAIK